MEKDEQTTLEEFERITRQTTLRALRDLPEEEVVRRYDLLRATPGFSPRLQADDYLNELTRRETERQSQRLEWLTWALVALTIVITVATVVLLVRGE